jgi:cyclophilin family peptidyl-prolyl cis-trans isomerase/HEAT repeat protein
MLSLLAARGSRLAVAGALLVALGCAPAAIAPAPSPAVVLGDAEIGVVASLMEAEDRRALDLGALREAAGDAHPEVRRRAALAGGRIGDRAAMPTLVHLLADGDTAVAANAAFGLGLLADTLAVEPLVAMLSGDAVRAAPTVAGEAATALSRMDHPAAHAALVSLLRDSGATGDAARLAIAPALLSFWRLPAGTDLTGPRRWADHADPDLRFAAAHALFRRPTPEALGLALTMAGDEDARVRLLALRGLAASVAESRRDAAWRVVAERASDPDPMVRIGALRAAATYAGSTSAALIARALDDEPPVALAAIEALGAMGTPAADHATTLAAIARDMEGPVQLRGAAVEALASVAPGDAAPVVAELAGSAEWRLRAAAARSAVRLAASPHEVRGLVRDQDARVAAAAYGALAARGTPAPAWEGVRALVRETLLSAEDVPLRAAALRALAPVATAPDLPLVLDAYGAALRDPEPDAAIAALEVLGALRERNVPVGRAFGLRFGRPEDARIHRAAAAALPDLAARWGPPGEVETGRTPEEYRELTRRWIAAPLARGPYSARVHTEAGTFDLALSPDAPLTVASFVSLAERGYFEGQEWPRVVPAFVIQGGDPRGDTSGGPGYAIRDELNRLRYDRGALGMALSGPDTGGSQFFVTHTPQPHLDGIHTVFGRVTSGMEAVDRTLAGHRISRIEIVSRPGTEP